MKPCSLLVVLALAAPFTASHAQTDVRQEPPPVVASNPAVDYTKYLELIQHENAQHRAFIELERKEHREFVERYLAWLGTLATIVVGVAAWVTRKEVLAWVKVRVNERFDAEVKRSVQTEVQREIQQLVDLGKNLVQGRAYYTAGLYVEAERFFRRVVELDTGHELATTNLAVCLSHGPNPRFSEALKLLNDVLARNPESWIAHYNYACVLYLMRGEATVREDIGNRLKKTFDKDPGYQMFARTDPDWEVARKSDPAFRKLLGL